MKQFNVTGMSCAACSSRVEKAVSAVEGVTSCSVSLLTNSMGVEGTADTNAIITAVENAGYEASEKGGKSSASKKNSLQMNAEAEAVLEDHETPKLAKRLVASLGFLLILMYFSMGHSMWGWPLPEFFDGNHIAIGLAQLLLSAVVMVINQKFFISGFKGLMHKSPNMDTLVALGSAASFVWSTYCLFAMTTAEDPMIYHHNLYFESAAMILTLITVGKMLEAHSKGKTTDALKSLMKLAPKTATILIDGVEKTVSVDEVNEGDIFIVRPGDSIPADGIVVEGSSAVDESALTGESIPVDKEPGEQVSAATINQAGYLKCRASRVGENTTLSQIIQMVSDAAATKAPIAKVADKVSGVFVPTVITIAVVTTFIWLMCGQSLGYALARGISVLVISCPCALGLATPVAIMVGNGVGARSGILFKTAVSLEQTGKMQIVALDKTGTITNGTPVVTDIVPVMGTEEELLEIAGALESKSEHPLATAVMKYINERQFSYPDVVEFKAIPGNGLSAVMNGDKIYGGNRKYICKYAKIDIQVEQTADIFASAGKTPFFFAKNDQIIGIIAVADTLKEDSVEAVRQLKNMGLRVVMLTGDNRTTAEAIAKQAGVDEVIAGVLPQGKESVICKLKEQGSVIMVGDGINDAPALTKADMGIAIGAGTDVAIDAADVVLMKSRLIDVPAAIRLSRKTLRNIHENLFWAFFYNIIGIPLAAGLWIPIFGWTLNPMFGAAAMSLSSFCVVSNALRLNFCKIYDSTNDKKIKQPEYTALIMEEEPMKKTMKIDGMMCMHCEARVKKTLEAIEGVAEAEVSHVAGTAVVTLTADVSNEILKSAVEAQDYKVLSVE